jgi:hypothetical protein
VGVGSTNSEAQGDGVLRGSCSSRGIEPPLLPIPVEGLLDYMKAVVEKEEERVGGGAAAEDCVPHCQLDNQEHQEQNCFRPAGVAMADCSCCKCAVGAASEVPRGVGEKGDCCALPCCCSSCRRASEVLLEGCALSGENDASSGCQDAVTAAEAGTGHLPPSHNLSVAASSTSPVLNRVTAAAASELSAGVNGLPESFSAEEAVSLPSAMPVRSLGTAAVHSPEQLPAAAAAPEVCNAAPAEDILTCGVCLDEGCTVVLTPCQHQLCVGCCRKLVESCRRPTSCPFCRQCIGGFKPVAAV